MTWTKIPDEWADRREFSTLSTDDRWHYLCMILFASRGDYSDGVLSVRQAQRVSDHPDPDGAIARLEEAGLLEVSPVAPMVRLVEIDMHFPPPSKRSDRTGAERQRRKRAHDKGDHTLCLPQHCPDAIATVTKRDGVTGPRTDRGNVSGLDVTAVTPDGRNATREKEARPEPVHLVTPSVTRDTGTGRDGTALTTQPSAEVGDVMIDKATGEVHDWPTAVPGEPDEWTSPSAPGVLLGGRS